MGDPVIDPLFNGSGRHSFVYFIRAGASGPMKIGYARNPMVRLQNMQVGNPATLHLIGAVIGGVSRERDIHRALAKYSLRGEWIKSTITVRRYVDDLLAREGVDLSKLAQLVAALPPLAPASAAASDSVSRALAITRRLLEEDKARRRAKRQEERAESRRWREERGIVLGRRGA